MRKQRKTLGGYFILPHPVHTTRLMFIVFAYPSASLFTYVPQANETTAERSRDVGGRGYHSIHCLLL